MDRSDRFVLDGAVIAVGFALAVAVTDVYGHGGGKDAMGGDLVTCLRDNE